MEPLCPLCEQEMIRTHRGHYWCGECDCDESGLEVCFCEYCGEVEDNCSCYEDEDEDDFE